jgi:hypothetical protein
MKKRIFLSLLLTIIFALAPFLLFRIVVEEVPVEESTIYNSEQERYNENLEDYNSEQDVYKEVNSRDYRHIYNSELYYKIYKEEYEQ